MSPIISRFFELAIGVTCGFIVIFLALLLCAAIILRQNERTFINRNHRDSFTVQHHKEEARD